MRSNLLCVARSQDFAWGRVWGGGGGCVSAPPSLNPERRRRENMGGGGGILSQEILKTRLPKTAYSAF